MSINKYYRVIRVRPNTGSVEELYNGKSEQYANKVVDVSDGDVKLSSYTKFDVGYGIDSLEVPTESVYDKDKI